MAMDEEPTTANRGDRESRTLLPNRESFYRDVTPLVAEADAAATSLVLLCIDIDGIDFILRTFGPGARDMLVADVGHRIQETAESNSAPYYITQNRFTVLMAETGYLHITRQAQALVDALRSPFDVAGVSYQLDAHVGISHYPNHADSIGELVRTCVFACHQARESHRDFAAFDQELDETERHRFRLMVDLQTALARPGEIRLAYQPLVELESGRCVGLEGLCRWNHPTLGPVPPAHFLPFVEHTSLMMPFTEATLGQGLDDLATWRSHGFEGVLAINLSPILFRRADLLERLLEPFRFSGMAAENLHFEITETGIMDQPNRAANTLAQIRDHGSRISVDDFGTGHSSLAYLADLPIDTIKIDKYFVQNLAQPWGEAIVGAAATLAVKLGLTTVAEGIEDEFQYRKCRELGVDVGQGFYIGYPMFREDLEPWLGESMQGGP